MAEEKETTEKSELDMFIEQGQEEPSAEETEETVESEGAETEETETVEEKPESTEETTEEVEEKPSFDWESDENPYKKRYRDTANYATQVNQENMTVKQQMASLEERGIQALTDIQNQIRAFTGEEPIEPSPATKPAGTDNGMDAFNERQATSLAIALQSHTQDELADKLYLPDSPFQKIQMNRPDIQQRVFNSKTPVQEALQIVEEEEFFAQHGRNPSQIMEKLKSELIPQLKSEWEKEFKEKLKASQELPKTIKGARAAPDSKTETIEEQEPSLDSILGK